jgi:5-methylcytosine-specific restriction protein B
MPLNPIIARRILDAHKRLEAEGAQLTTQQLTQYRNAFRARFGPETLAGLDGLQLLETMHDFSQRSSLVYWLEFKNDEEFPSTRFGSIQGGSALKYGIYRRKENGVWMQGRATAQAEISVEQAIEVARKHRDQFVAGASILQAAPDPADYDAMQRQLDAAAPDLADTAWGHKYFSILFPEVLDDFHVETYQRFQLLKMLVKPPQGSGRYRAAGQFIAGARELGLDINLFDGVLNALHGSPHKYWLIRTGTDDQPGREWEAMRDGGYVAIPWGETGSLAHVEPTAPGKEALRKSLAETWPDRGAPAHGRSATQIFRFIKQCEPGHVVVASDGSRTLGLGRITGGYEYLPGPSFGHRRQVEWLALGDIQLREPDGARSAIQEIKSEDDIIAIETRLLSSSPIVRPIGGSQPGGSPEGVTSPSGPLVALRGIQARIQAALDRKGQVVLYGPPGTGKTWHAEQTTQELAARGWLHKSWAQLTEQERVDLAPAVEMCSFHPAFGYEDFLEGYRPREQAGALSFECRDGIFKRLCDRATDVPDKPFFLIIDEINRGDVPRIFGELLTVVEMARRGRHVLLPLSGRTFAVPPNVFIVGTMNTADRSIALLDVALRRRFAFIELLPDSRVLEDASVQGVPLQPWLDALNGRLLKHLGLDARNLQVGHAYFMHAGKPIVEMNRLAAVVRDDLVPLLEEYCYDTPSALAAILGTTLVTGDPPRIDHALFERSRQADLAMALLQPCPEIIATLQAVSADAAAALEDEAAESDAGQDA